MFASKEQRRLSPMGAALKLGLEKVVAPEGNEAPGSTTVEQTSLALF